VAVEILPGPESVAAAAAGRVRAAAEAALEWRGQFRMLVPGGRTPARLFRLLAAEPSMAWDRIEIGFADERAVPQGHAERNDRQLGEALLEPLGDRAPRIERMMAEWPDLHVAAREYDAWLREPADLVVLGLGEDGHIASLFPRSALLGERARRVAAVFDSPKPPARRLTITPRVLTEARAVLVLATGSEKAIAVARALAKVGNVADCPARLVRDAEWIVERAAATALR